MWLWILLIVLIFGGGGIALAETGGTVQQPTTPCPCPGGAVLACPQTLCVVSILGGASVITNDPSTWPGDESDPIWKTAHGIAFAEGANIAGSVPDRLNNPGDISDGASEFGSKAADGSQVTDFPDKETGWTWLYSKLGNIVAGSSSVYSPNMTWTQIAQKWAGNWQAWVNNVTSYVGVSPSDRFGNFFGV